MAERAKVLADMFEQAVDEFVSTVEGLSAEQWRMLCPDEERSVGVLTRHVAAAIPFEMTVFREIAGGQQPATITSGQLAEMNARDAEDWEDCTKDETLALLRGNAAEAAAELRHLSEEQLGRTGSYIAELPAWTLQQWLERILIGHINGHHNSIRTAVAVETTR